VNRLKEEPPVLVALDFSSADAVEDLVGRFDPTRCGLKVGKELFASEGPDLVRKLVDRGFNVFLDLKFHDIPTTVAKAVQAAARMGVWMVNVHASGGSTMIRAAREALEDFGEGRPLLTAVTVLTSMDEKQLYELGVVRTLEQQVMELARLARERGAEGVVCSAREAVMLREEFGGDFVLVTPGIRPSGSDNGDQSRVVTPARAIQDGASFLVVGRPITQASDPLAVLHTINDDISYSP
jgi:orotidine-5'-phosphate decarboxylase